MSDAAQNPGARMYEEFVAVHTVLRRGTRLVRDAYEGLAGGRGVDAGTLVEAARWLLAYTHSHHRAEDDLFWPVLHGLYPDAEADLKALSDDHVVLDQELNALERAVEDLDRAITAGQPPVGTPEYVRAGAEAAHRVHEVLTGHLIAEEAAVHDLFPGVSGDDIAWLREAIVQGSPDFGVHFMLGLLEDPEPARGFDLLTENFPQQLRDVRPQMLRRYEQSKRALTARTGGNLG